MAELLQRLLKIARAHLEDVLDVHVFGSSARPSWYTDFADAADAGTFRSTAEASPGTSAHTQSGLPYSPELARCYALLDLPFGTPMEEVSKQWKTYLKKCHPDRFAIDPAQQADATELTQALTGAHDTIQAAWKKYHT